mmetsp:Transcript_26870/g.45333  ORF Transcript_26870/g.45333 Transcript_26870/m.45333 type:complete len:638 (-) Transcript_26870:209-2122(-)
MFQSVVFSILTGAFAGIQFELFANEIPNAALLNAAILHLWTVISGVLTFTCYQYIVHSKIPLKWSLGVVILAYLFLHFKSLAMENLPMPVFLVCSNMKLIVTLVVDYFLFSKPFATFGQIIGVIGVTVGCILITLQSQNFADGKEYTMEYNIPLGLGYVALSVIAVSLLLPLSNLAVTNHSGSSFDELFFMQNFLSMPLFFPNLDKLALSVSALRESAKIVDIPLPPSLMSAVSHVSVYLANLDHQCLQPVAVFLQKYLPERLSVTSVQVPLGAFFLLGTIALTPIHRKQISHISISANNSVIGQLIVCAVKTVVLLALFVILHQNSSNVSSDSASGAMVIEPAADPVMLENFLDACVWWGRVVVRQAWLCCDVIFSTLQASVTPQIALGVLLQTAGSIVFILASESPPKQQAARSKPSSTKLSSEEESSSDAEQCSTRSSSADEYEYDERRRTAYTSSTTLDMLNVDNSTKLYHSSKQLNNLETERFSCTDTERLHVPPSRAQRHSPCGIEGKDSGPSLKNMPPKELSDWEKFAKKKRINMKNRSVVLETDKKSTLPEKTPPGSPTSGPSSPLRKNPNLLGFLNEPTRGTDVEYQPKSPDERRRERRRRLLQLRQRGGGDDKGSVFCTTTNSDDEH